MPSVRAFACCPVDIQESDWETTLLSKDTLRLGLRFVRGVRASAIQHAPSFGNPIRFRITTTLNRTLFQTDELERLAEAGALAPFGQTTPSSVATRNLKHNEPLFTALPYQ